jgi:hypothetical protein
MESGSDRGDVREQDGDDTAVGDTPEAHDEVNPHDLPPDHPGRPAAEEQAGDEAGTTRGDSERAAEPPSRDEADGEG